MDAEDEKPGATWRNATAADDEAILGLVTSLYREDPSPEDVSVDNARATLEALRREPIRGRVVVLESQSAVVGYAFLIAFWSNELGGETCEIDELYVAGSHRGRGFASTLIDALTHGSPLWSRWPVALCLQVTPSNHRAMKLYERLGFQRRKNIMLVRRPA